MAYFIDQSGKIEVRGIRITYKGKLEPDINLTENEIMKIIKRLVNI